MRIIPVNNNYVPNFNGIREKDNVSYTNDQKTLVNDLKTILNQKFPTDIHKRTYTKYIEDKCGYDLLIEPDSNPQKINLKTVSRLNNEENLLAQYDSDNKPKPELFTEFGEVVSGSIKFSTGLLSLFIASFVLGLELAPKIFDKIFNEPSPAKPTKELVVDSINKTAKDTLVLSKKIIK